VSDAQREILRLVVAGGHIQSWVPESERVYWLTIPVAESDIQALCDAGDLQVVDQYDDYLVYAATDAGCAELGQVAGVDVDKEVEG
jgi:hypothetical protein